MPGRQCVKIIEMGDECIAGNRHANAHKGIMQTHRFASIH